MVSKSFFEHASPIVIIGMHRSGTSLLAELLQSAGIFMGKDLEEHHESRFFHRQNQMILKNAHAEWDNPLPMTYLLDDSQAVLKFAGRIRASLKSEDVQMYLGANKSILARFFRNSATQFPSLWGWKDPRTTFTLPIWLNVFPRLRVLNVFRNGVDVANSLRAREQSYTNQMNWLIVSYRCIKLERAFQLWEEYVAMSFRVTSVLPSEQVYNLRYETLLEHPERELRQLAAFIGIDDSMADFGELVAKVNPGRANAFTHDPELYEFYSQVLENPWMQRLGYSDPSKHLGQPSSEF